MFTKPKSFICKLVAFLVLTSFIITQTGWAAPQAYGRNLRQTARAEQQQTGAGAIGDPIANELMLKTKTVSLAAGNNNLIRELERKNGGRKIKDLYNRWKDGFGLSECRIAGKYLGNVLKDLQRGLELQLTGGYDGSGKLIQAKINDKFYLFLSKRRGHAKASKSQIEKDITKQLIEAIAKEYAVPVKGVLLRDFEYDRAHKGEVLVVQIHPGREIRIPISGMGHTRWGTIGSPSDPHSHPFLEIVDELKLKNGRSLEFGLAHNGNFRTHNLFRRIMVDYFNEKFRGITDSEVMTKIGARMHRGKTADEPVVSTEQAVKRMLRLIKQVEDWKALVALSEGFVPKGTAEIAQRLSKTIISKKVEEMRPRLNIPPKQSISPESIALYIIEEAMREPWRFDDGEYHDLWNELTKNIQPEVQKLIKSSSLVADLQRSGLASDKIEDKVKKSAKRELNNLKRKYVTYSTIAIIAASNVADGFVLAKGEEGGTIYVSVPPIEACLDYLRVAQKDTEKLTETVSNQSFDDSLRGGIILTLQKVEDTLTELIRTNKEKGFGLTSDNIERLRSHLKNLDSFRSKLLQLNQENISKFIQDFKGFLNQVISLTGYLSEEYDTKEIYVASEPRALAVAGRTHNIPDLSNAGRGIVDIREVRNRHVCVISNGPQHFSHIYPGEASEISTKSQMIDFKNIELRAPSWFEQEIQNGRDGIRDTVRYGIDESTGLPTATDINYPDEELKGLTDLFIVAQGSSFIVGKELEYFMNSRSKLNIKVTTGQGFKRHTPRKITEYDPRSQKGRIGVMLITNTGSTQEILEAAQMINEINAHLDPEERIILFVMTNVPGSPVDVEVAELDGKTHADYTLLPFENSVPATQSVPAFILKGKLTLSRIAWLQGDLTEEQLRHITTKALQASDVQREKILLESSNGQLNIPSWLKDKVTSIIQRFHIDLPRPTIWFVGLGVYEEQILEDELKGFEEWRLATVRGFPAVKGKHGPYAMLTPGDNVVAFVPNEADPDYEEMVQSIQEIRSRIDKKGRGGRKGTLVVVADESVADDLSIKNVADVIVPLPLMDDEVTGPVFSLTFVHILVLEGIYKRFGHVRQLLLNIEKDLEQKGIIDTVDKDTGSLIREGKRWEIKDEEGNPVIIETADQVLDFFSYTLTPQYRVGIDRAREILAELSDVPEFKTYYQRSQLAGVKKVGLTLELLQQIINKESKLPEGEQRRLTYAQQALKELQAKQEYVDYLRKEFNVLLKASGIDLKHFARQYHEIASYNVTPAEAVRFIHTGWQEFFADYPENISKKLSGVVSLLDREMREALQNYETQRELDILDDAMFAEKIIQFGMQRMHAGRIFEYPGALNFLAKALSRVRGYKVTPGELRRQAMFEEAIHALLENDRNYVSIINKVRQSLVTKDGHNRLEFRQAFEEEFGQFNKDSEDPDGYSDALIEEVIVKYHVGKFTGHPYEALESIKPAVETALPGALQSLFVSKLGQSQIAHYVEVIKKARDLEILSPRIIVIQAGAGGKFEKIAEQVKNGAFDDYLTKTPEQMPPFEKTDPIDHILVMASDRTKLHIRLLTVIGARQTVIGWDARPTFRRAIDWTKQQFSKSENELVESLSFIALQQAKSGLTADAKATFSDAIEIAKNIEPTNKLSGHAQAIALNSIANRQSFAYFFNDANTTINMIDKERTDYIEDALETLKIKQAESAARASANDDNALYDEAWKKWWEAWGKKYPKIELESLLSGKENEIAEARAHSLLLMMQIIGINNLYDALKANDEHLAHDIIKEKMDLFRAWVNEYMHETIKSIKNLQKPEDVTKLLKEEFASDDPSPATKVWGHNVANFANLTVEDKDKFFSAFHRDIAGRFSNLQTHLLGMIKTDLLDDQIQIMRHYQKYGDHILLEFLNRYRERYKEGVIVMRDAGGHILTSFPEELRDEKFIIDILPYRNPEKLDPMPWDVPGWERLFNTRIDGYSVHIVRPLPDTDVSKGFMVARAEALSKASANGDEKLRSITETIKTVEDGKEGWKIIDEVVSTNGGLTLEQAKPIAEFLITVASKGKDFWQATWGKRSNGDEETTDKIYEQLTDCVKNNTTEVKKLFAPLKIYDKRIGTIAAVDIDPIVRKNSEGKIIAVVDKNSERLNAIVQALQNSDIFNFEHVYGFDTLEEAASVKPDYLLDFTGGNSIPAGLFDELILKGNIIDSGLENLEIPRAIEKAKVWLYTQL